MLSLDKYIKSEGKNCQKYVNNEVETVLSSIEVQISSRLSDVIWMYILLQYFCSTHILSADPFLESFQFSVYSSVYEPQAESLTLIINDAQWILVMAKLQ